MQVVHIDFVADDVLADLIRCAVDDAGFHVVAAALEAGRRERRDERLRARLVDEDVIALAIFGLALMTVASLRFRKRLD